MKKLALNKGFDSVIKFLEILHILSISKEKRHLASEAFITIKEDEKGDRVNKMYKYILENFNNQNFRITHLAYQFNMNPSAFGHFFKRCTNENFTQFVIDLRLGHASKLLIDSDLSISEIAYKSGFNNIANFNRLFKKNRLITPKHYRKKLIKSPNLNWEKQLANSHQFVPSSN
ncbi:MAG: helix-turn-helix transcriptional regulator [Bacteroidetes bacterium]|nr:helix-turn-helix transcriptional regulator [Bacteroidota bacterium]